MDFPSYTPCSRDVYGKDKKRQESLELGNVQLVELAAVELLSVWESGCVGVSVGGGKIFAMEGEYLQAALSLLKKAGRMDLVRQEALPALRPAGRWRRGSRPQESVTVGDSQASTGRLGPPDMKSRRSQGRLAEAHHQDCRCGGVWLRTLSRSGVEAGVLRSPAPPLLGSSIRANRGCSRL
ncbi:hypothetical protein NDU88_001969 [Pleurodeles waltl]|uniref:Uncharacterized protein n=1 Tax=Pleurodeles waltl TaxID=8319 RepID=A0AAV7U9L0_PLEWA|nr:hypothetical protein NDU88_001969 [Pleurodeles waltl]